MLVLALFLFFLALLARLIHKNWLAPGALFALVWFAVVLTTWLGPSLYVRWAPIGRFSPSDYTVWTGAMLWVAVAVFAVSVGSFLGGGGSALSRPGPPLPSTLSLPSLNWVAAAITVLAIASVVALRGSWAVPTQLQQALMGCLWASPIFGGLLMASSPSVSGRLIALASLSPPLLLGVPAFGRTTIIMGLLLWIVSFLASRLLVERSRFAIRSSYVVFGVLLLSLAFAIVVLGQWLRFERTGVPSAYRYEDQLDVSIYKVRSAYFGFLPAFSHWFEDYWLSPTGAVLGRFTFSGPLDYFGFRERASFPNFEIDPDVNTNVFTLHRHLIEDFTPAGALLFLFLVGLLGGRAYYKVARGESLYLALLVPVNFFLIYSWIGSPFRYNSYVAAFLMLAVYLFVVSRSSRVSMQEP